MKRREFLKLSGTIAGAAMTVYLPAGWTPAKAAAKWKVGFSQATTLEPWRVQFNKDIEAEAKNHPEVELIITDGQDKTEKQVADVENLIVQQVDVLLISPKESAGLTGVVEKAIDAKIPVIVLDRNVDTKRITQFIGGDNVLIGKAAGEYAVKLLGGPGKAAGQCRRDLGRHGHRSPRTTATTASTPSPTRSPASSTCSTTSRATGSRTRPTTS